MEETGPVTIVAKTIVWNKDGKVLTLRRSKTDPRRPLTWDLPGGLVEYGENPQEAAKRETEEETGITLSGLKIMDVDSHYRSKYVISLIFEAKVGNPEVKISWEHDQYQWVVPEELQKMDIPDKYKQAVAVAVEASGGA